VVTGTQPTLSIGVMSAEFVNDAAQPACAKSGYVTAVHQGPLIWFAVVHAAMISHA